MDFEPFDYMRFAKRLEYAPGVYLAGSGMPTPRAEDVGFQPEDYALESLCHNYGDPRNMDWLSRQYGCEGGNVVLTAGSSSANFLAFAALLKQGDRVIIESPGYAQFFSLASLVGATPVPLPRRFESGFTPDPAEFKRLLKPRTPLAVLTNLHNPTMAATPREVLAEIVAAAAANGTQVLVDEVYIHHLLPGQGDTSAWGLGDNVIVTTSLTKVYGLSGLRFGWALAPRATAARMVDLTDIVDPQLVPIAQNLAWRALQNLPRLRPAARRLHEAHWPIVRQWLQSRPDLEYFAPPGGIVVWVRIKDAQETTSLCEFLRTQHGVMLVPGEVFQSPGWVRLGFRAEPTRLRDGLERFGRGLDAWRKRGG